MPVVVCGGGSAYFGLVYEVETQRFDDLHVNSGLWTDRASDMGPVGKS